jgi:hypothetical protein
MKGAHHVSSQNTQDLVQRRLQISLSSLLGKLEQFVEADGKDLTALVFYDIEEARTAVGCLAQLRLHVDASRLTERWIQLHKWALGPVMNGVLAEIASKEPEQREWLRAIFGPFPSSEEMETATQALAQQSVMAVLLARELRDRLRYVEAALSPQATPSVPSGALPDDETAYVPASVLLTSDEFPKSPTDVHRALKQHPEIRRKHPISKTKGTPIPNRTLVHVGDWHQYLAQRRQSHSDPLDQRADVVDAFLDIERRKAEERNRRAVR